MIFREGESEHCQKEMQIHHRKIDVCINNGVNPRKKSQFPKISIKINIVHRISLLVWATFWKKNKLLVISDWISNIVSPFQLNIPLTPQFLDIVIWSFNSIFISFLLEDMMIGLINIDLKVLNKMKYMIRFRFHLAFPHCTSWAFCNQQQNHGCPFVIIW